MSALGGVTLLHKYSDSLILLFPAIYPEYEWLPWRFSYCPKSYWDNEQNVKKFLDWAGKELGVKDISDWSKVPTEV